MFDLYIYTFERRDFSNILLNVFNVYKLRGAKVTHVLFFEIDLFFIIHLYIIKLSFVDFILRHSTDSILPRVLTEKVT